MAGFSKINTSKNSFIYCLHLGGGHWWLVNYLKNVCLIFMWTNCEHNHWTINCKCWVWKHDDDFPFSARKSVRKCPEILNWIHLSKKFVSKIVWTVNVHNILHFDWNCKGIHRVIEYISVLPSTVYLFTSFGPYNFIAFQLFCYLLIQIRKWNLFPYALCTYHKHIYNDSAECPQIPYE